MCCIKYIHGIPLKSLKILEAKTNVKGIRKYRSSILFIELQAIKVCFNKFNLTNKPRFEIELFI